MGLLKPAVTEQAYAKIGLLGFPGSGKTRTSAEIAKGIWLEYQLKKPVGMIDTENGSDFLVPIFKEAKIPFEVAKTKSFQDLIAITDDCEKNYSVLIIDSITHIWNDFMQSYLNAKKKTSLRFHDYNILKPTWQNVFTLPRFLNSKLHMIVSGRAGYEYDTTPDEETGTYEVRKSGIKMKAESEFGFEPSLLLQMERIQDLNPKSNKVEEVHVECLVLKDRTDTINGRRFVKPTFKDFFPHISRLNIGGTHASVDPNRATDPSVFKRENWQDEAERIKIKLEEIEGELVSMIPGQSADAKKQKADLLQQVFGTRSWTAIEGMKESQLMEGLAKIRKILYPVTIKPETNGKEDKKEATTK